MQTKLTLRLDQHLIEQAKLFAQRRNKSLSQVVEEYFTLLSRADKPVSAATLDDLPPITQSLYGLLRNANLDEQDYKNFLRTF